MHAAVQAGSLDQWLTCRRRTPIDGWLAARLPSSQRCAAAPSQWKRLAAGMHFPRKSCSPGSARSRPMASPDCAPLTFGVDVPVDKTPPIRSNDGRCALRLFDAFWTQVAILRTDLV